MQRSEPARRGQRGARHHASRAAAFQAQPRPAVLASRRLRTTAAHEAARGARESIGRLAGPFRRRKLVGVARRRRSSAAARGGATTWGQSAKVAALRRR